MQGSHAGFVDDAGIFHIISRVAEHRNHRIKSIWVVVDGKLLVILVGDDGCLRRDNVVNLRKTIKRVSVASGAMAHFVVSPPVKGVERHAHTLLRLLALVHAQGVRYRS